MLRNIDPHATRAARRIRIGDRLRFPLDRLGNLSTYPRDFEVVAFGGCGQRHCAVVRRLHDGWTTTVAQHWITTYQER